MKRVFKGYAILARSKGEHNLLYYTFSRTADKATTKYLNTLSDVAENYKKPNYQCKAVKMTLEVIEELDKEQDDKR